MCNPERTGAWSRRPGVICLQSWRLSNPMCELSTPSPTYQVVGSLAFAVCQLVLAGLPSLHSCPPVPGTFPTVSGVSRISLLRPPAPAPQGHGCLGSRFHVEDGPGPHWPLRPLSRCPSTLVAFRCCGSLAGTRMPPRLAPRPLL